MNQFNHSELTLRIVKKGENAEGHTEVTINHSERGLDISLPGHGDYSSQDNKGCPIYLEHYEGKFYLRVWADINEE